MGPFAAVGLTWNSVVKAEVVGSSKLSANIPEPLNLRQDGPVIMYCLSR
jgi:hypothetical protein